MYKILKKEYLANNIWLMDIEAPRVAKSCQPGQFVIVKMDEKGERIPLTVCDYDREKGTVTIVFQTVGASTTEMAKYEVGESFMDFVGPLGCPSELIEMPLEELKKEKILFVCGGVGTGTDDNIHINTMLFHPFYLWIYRSSTNTATDEKNLFFL